MFVQLMMPRVKPMPPPPLPAVEVQPKHNRISILHWRRALFAVAPQAPAAAHQEEAFFLSFASSIATAPLLTFS
jgi:hypothetical protein